MVSASEWFDIGGEVLSGRAQQRWKGVYPSAEAWMGEKAAQLGCSVATLRRWAAGRRFLDTIAGQGGFPDLEALRGLRFALVEKIITLHRLNPEGAAASAREAVAGGVTMRKLRDDAQRIAAPRESAAKRQRWEEQGRLLRGLGEPNDLVSITWPTDLAFPKPDLLLANADRIVAVGLIGARPDATSTAKVSWSVAVSGLVDAVWLIGPKGGTFPRDALGTLMRLGDIAKRVGVAVVDDEFGAPAVLRLPAEGVPQPDFRPLIRHTIPAARPSKAGEEKS